MQAISLLEHRRQGQHRVRRIERQYPHRTSPLGDRILPVGLTNVEGIGITYPSVGPHLVEAATGEGNGHKHVALEAVHHDDVAVQPFQQLQLAVVEGIHKPRKQKHQQHREPHPRQGGEKLPAIVDQV